MSLLKERPPTPRRLAANHANARKSTGPRTPAGKARLAIRPLKHGLYAGRQYRTMLALGEDPKEFDALERELMEEWQATTATKRRLVSRLADLLWKQNRVERGQQGLVARQIEDLELERARRARGIGQGTYEGLSRRVELVGLRNVKDSPGKFEGCLTLLRMLADQVKSRDFGGDFASETEASLRALYGQLPSWRSKFFRNSIRRLGKPESGTATPDESEVEFLEHLLREEILEVEAEYELYKRGKVEISPALRDAQMLPKNPGGTLALRQENSLARQIERTVKLLRVVETRGRTKAEG